MTDYKPWEEPAFEGLRGIIGRYIKYPLLDYRPKLKDGVFFNLKNSSNIQERDLEIMELAIEQGHPITPYDEEIVRLHRGPRKMSWKEFNETRNRLEELGMERSEYIEVRTRKYSGIIDDRFTAMPGLL